VAQVRFTVRREVDVPARPLFDELIDWRGHAEWVPMTRVVVETGDGGPGTVFVATTGLGPLALPDRMRVDAVDVAAMTARVTKIGPVLTGVVDLAVTDLGTGRCRVDWVEDIRVPYLPQLLARPVGAAARLAFTASIKALGRRVARRALPAAA
jgi:hypothetical protein